MKLYKILKNNVFLIVAIVFLLGFIGLNGNITGLSLYTFVDTSNETISIPIEENITLLVNETVIVENITETIENITYGIPFKTLASISFSNATNTTGIAQYQNITLNITISSATALLNYTLEWNDTGTAVNISTFQAPELLVTWYVNTSLRITASPNQLVWWRYYANDGYNYVKSDTYNFTVVVNTAPTHSNPILNSTFGTNLTTENLTVYNQSTYDLNGNSIKNIINWYLNGTSITVLNMPFEAGNTTWDYSNNSRHGTAIGPTWNSAGGYDGKGAYQFDGANDYINISRQPNLSRGFTFIAWVKRTGNTTNVDAVIMSQAIFNNNQFFIRSQPYGENSSQPWEAFVSLTDGTVDPRANSGVTSTIGRWFFIAVNWDKIKLNMYVDGVLSASTPRAGNLNNTIIKATIGAGEQTNPNTDWFNGTIDDVLIFNRSLSGDEIWEIYNNRTNVMHFNETSAGDVWKTCITPNDGINDGAELCSNNLTVQIDTQAPTFSNPSNDTGIRTNNNITLNINITDNTAVRNYTLEWNNTGTAVNISQFQISGTYASWYANTSLSISASANQIIWWRYYACDFANNCNVSATYNFTVAITPSTPPDTGGGTNPATPPVTPPVVTPPVQPPEEILPEQPPVTPPEEIVIPSIEDTVEYVISDIDYGEQHIKVIFDNNTLTTFVGNNTLIGLTIIDNKPKIDLDFKLETPTIEYPHIEQPRIYFLGIYGAIWLLLILLLIICLVYRETKKEAKEFRREVIRLPSLEITKNVRIFNRFIAEFIQSFVTTLIKSFLVGLASIFTFPLNITTKGIIFAATIISRIFLILYYTITSAIILIINKIGRLILLIILFLLKEERRILDNIKQFIRTVILADRKLERHASENIVLATNTIKKLFIKLIIGLENIYIKLAKATRQEIKRAKQIIKEVEEFTVKEVKKEHSELQYQRIFSHINYLLPYFEIEIEKGNYKQICSELDLAVKAFRKLPSALQLDAIEQQLTKQSKAITIGLLLEQATEYLNKNKKKELQQILAKITSYGYIPKGAIKDKLYRYITEYSIDSLRKDYNRILNRLTEYINKKDLTKAIEEYANFIAIHNSLLKYWGINKEELVAELKKQQDRLHLLFLREKAYSRIKPEEIKLAFEKVAIIKPAKETISPTEKKFNKLLTRIKRLLNANDLDLAIKHYQELVEFYNSIESTLLAEEKSKIYGKIKDIYDEIVFKELELKAKEKLEIKPVNIKYEKIKIEAPKPIQEEKSPQIEQFDKKLLRIKKLLRENRLDEAMKEYDELVKYYNALQGENE